VVLIFIAHGPPSRAEALISDLSRAVILLRADPILSNSPSDRSPREFFEKRGRFVRDADDLFVA
jgi:hypothetical protein